MEIIPSKKSKQFSNNNTQSNFLYSLKINYNDNNISSSPPNTFLENLEKRITNYQVINKKNTTTISSYIHMK